MTGSEEILEVLLLLIVSRHICDNDFSDITTIVSVAVNHTSSIDVRYVKRREVLIEFPRRRRVRNYNIDIGSVECDNKISKALLIFFFEIL